MLGFLGLMLTLALLVMYAVQLGYKASNGFLGDGGGLFVRQAVYMAGGLVLMFLISRIHHQRLYRYSWMIYGLSVGLIWAAHLWSQFRSMAFGVIFSEG